MSGNRQVHKFSWITKTKTKSKRRGYRADAEAEADADREAEVLALDPLPELEEATYMSTLLPTVTLVPDEGVVRSTVPGAAVSEFS